MDRTGQEREEVVEWRTEEGRLTEEDRRGDKREEKKEKKEVEEGRKGKMRGEKGGKERGNGTEKK